MKVDDRVKRAKKGDKEALLSLIMDRKTEFYKLAYVYTENKEDALDAMEDMIVILYEQIGSLKKEDSFYSWSKTILVNCCKSILKKNKKVLPMEEVKEEGYEENFENREHSIDIMESLKMLNEHQAEAIKLKYIIDMDYESIAKIGNVPVGTVKSRIFTGLKKLKEYFGGDYS